MSELKAIKGGDIHDAVEFLDFHRPANGEYPEDTDYYLRSEADRVIAELKRQIKFLKVTHNSCGDCNKCADGMGKVFDEYFNELKAQKAQAEEYATQSYKELRHNKYKRCLAMADKCVDLCNKAKNLYRWAEDENLEYHYNHKIEFFARWHNRWMELAEKFKPNKEAK